MILAQMKTKLRLLFAVCVLSAISNSCSTSKLLPPAVVADVDIPKLVQPVSNIEVPITVDLRKSIAQAEASVPLTFTDNQQPCEGLRYAYTFTRSPFNISGKSNVVNLKFTGSYGISASYCAKCANLFGKGGQCLAPTPLFQCGIGEEPRRMEIAYQSTINVLQDYHLSSKTILYPAPIPIDRCNIVLGQIDVTERLMQYIIPKLDDLGKQVDARVAAYEVRPVIQNLWKNLNAEIKVGDVGFVSINPQAVRLSNLNLNGSTLSFSVGLSAKPVVTTVSRPAADKPLPNLSAYTPAGGFNIYLDLLENYDHLSDMANQQAAGQKAETAGKTFIVDHIKIYGAGKQIAMQVDFKGSNTGTVFLVGTPTYDPVKHVISFPDLAFDLQTRAWMLKAAKWMFNSKITDMLRQRATYNLSSFITSSKTRIEKQMSTDMGNGVHSDVTIQDLNIEAIYPTTGKLIVRTLSRGQIKVKVAM